MKKGFIAWSLTGAVIINLAAFILNIYPFISEEFTGVNQSVMMEDKEMKLDGFECSEGWRITGYFTPIEADYTSKASKQVEIKDVGKMSFNAEFVDVVFNEAEGWGEGWGKTRFGWYLGNYDGAWHKADAPLDANNAPLKANSIAVDNNLIPNGSIVKIPDLPAEYSAKTFVANDVGVTVHGKHVDIYTGEGKDAEREMYRVTFEDENLLKVCYKKSD